MNQQDQKKGPLSSLLPVMIMGLAIVIAMRFFQKSDKKPPEQAPPHVDETVPKRLADFEFPKASVGSTGELIEVDTGVFHARLSEVGGRIYRFYLKSRDELPLPDSVIDQSGDEMAKKLKALEVTRDNGMDFQPHLYYRRPGSQNYWQIKSPPLNEGRFRSEQLRRDEKSGKQEVRFSIPLRFKGHRLELIKLYRFFPREHFFRQITVLLNRENREFNLGGGDLFYKTFGDIGPLEESKYTRTPPTRFYYYGEKLQEKKVGVKDGGGCMGGLFCGSGNGEEVNITAHPNTLEFLGGTSRYFFAYSKFIGSPNTEPSPDGLIMVDKDDPTGRETGTAFFSNFRLAPASGERLDLGDIGVARPGQETYKRVLKTRGRKDALVIDNQVFFGVRTDESHAYRDEKSMKSEFGLDEPDKNARDALFAVGYFSYFSKIKDAIVWLMRLLHGLIGNYGWSIIIIAVVAKLITFPLNQMQAKSMKKMTALKPEIDKLNELYADDPQEKQKKMMEIYQKNNINPAKGCLPMLIQMPIFLALFAAFSEAIELWNSPFILWMTDLSSPDTVYVFKDLFFAQNVSLNILPLFMVGSQILSQQFTTMTTDPQQKVLMYIMPAVFIFIFWSMPSGVTLYWTVQNILGIVWQLAINKFSTDEAKPAK